MRFFRAREALKLDCKVTPCFSFIFGSECTPSSFHSEQSPVEPHASDSCSCQATPVDRLLHPESCLSSRRSNASFLARGSESFAFITRLRAGNREREDERQCDSASVFPPCFISWSTSVRWTTSCSLSAPKRVRAGAGGRSPPSRPSERKVFE